MSQSISPSASVSASVSGQSSASHGLDPSRMWVFRFTREIQGQPPTVWKVGDKIVYDPNEQNPPELHENILTTWSGHGVNWDFTVGVDIELDQTATQDYRTRKAHELIEDMKRRTR